MKILLVTNELSEQSGWGRYSLDLANHLKLADHELVVVCRKINPVFSEFEQIALLPDPLDYKKCYLFFWLYLSKIFEHRGKLKKADLIHCVVETYLPFSTIYSFFARVPLLATVHGSFGVKASRQSVYCLVQSLCYSWAKKIVCVSHYTEKRLLAVFPRVKTVVIPNGVDLKNFLFDNNELSKSLDNPILIGVGAIKNRKGFHLVVKALPDILKKFPKLKYYIVGRPEEMGYLKYLKDLICELNLEEHVVFFHNLTDEELKKLYEQASVFILTPISDEYNFEGFGLVYLEANAYGLPVVGSYDNGGEEAIASGKTGFLAKANDVESTSEEVINLLSDFSRYATMSREALSWAKAHSWETIASQYMQIYKQIHDN